MKINILPVKMSQEEAMRYASGYHNLAVKLTARGKKINLKLMYLEHRVYIMELTYMDTPFIKKLRRKPLPDKQKIRIFVDATTCSASYLEEPLKTQQITVPDTAVQGSHYEDQRLEDAAAMLAKRIVRRRTGRNLHIETLSMEKIYRPYYIAIYGEMKMGTKARYYPIPADGYKIFSNI